MHTTGTGAHFEKHWFNGLCLVPFLCTGMTNDIFRCFGTSDSGREQLKINDKGNINA